MREQIRGETKPGESVTNRWARRLAKTRWLVNESAL